MKTKKDKWDLDRIPTKWERIYGTFFSLIIFVVMALLLLIVSLPVLRDEVMTTKIFFKIIVFALFFFYSAYLLYRVAFSKRTKSSPRTLIITGYFVGGISILLIFTAMLGLGSGPRFFGIAISGLVGSAKLIHKGRQSENS